MNIRPTKSKDIPFLEQVLDETGLFPKEMLADMISDFFHTDKFNEVWLTCEADQSPIGFCYAKEEQLAKGTWNMLAIAVLPSCQGMDAGKALVKELESHLRISGNRVLIAETSGLDDFSATRAFYGKNGYVEEARIRDFWDQGDDKVIFLKSL